MTSTVCILLPAHWGAAKGGAESQAHCLADSIAEHTKYQVTFLTREAPVPSGEYGYKIHSFRGPTVFQSLRWGYWPDSIALYKELAWIYWHKIGDFLDDEHMNYKRALAAQMERVLGPPPIQSKMADL